MNQEVMIIVDEAEAMSAAGSLFEKSPRAMLKQATHIANVLKDVIKQQNLSMQLSGKEYVKHEGWATLGSLLGILPREKSVREVKAGVYEAVVELYSIKTGAVVGQGSSICGDEKTWEKRDSFAKRSMAITRATGKAYRLGFAWIMAIAGYEPTPAEEMAAAAPIQINEPVAEIFSKDNEAQVKRIKDKLSKISLGEDFHHIVVDAMDGNPISSVTFDMAVKIARKCEG
jgi:hypothetical protein